MIETVQFELKENVEELMFVAEIERTKPIIAALEGFVKRCVAKSENGAWIDMLEWESEIEFQSLEQVLENTDDLKNYLEMINISTAKSQSFELEARYFSA